MLKTVAMLGLAGALILGAGVGVAGTPFGGDDYGFIPPNKPTALCENSVGKALGKAAACILKCHKKRASGLLDETGEDNCEKNLPAAADCFGKYDAVTGNASNINASCPGCLSPEVRHEEVILLENIIDDTNAAIYCSGSAGWGGDEAGSFLPELQATAKCENAVGKAAGKLIACIFKCHKARASGKLTDDAAEDNCEKGASPSSCRSRLMTAIGSLSCPPCIHPADIFDEFEANLDNSILGNVYCASPSGAFLDAAESF